MHRKRKLIYSLSLIIIIISFTLYIKTEEMDRIEELSTNNLLQVDLASVMQNSFNYNDSLLNADIIIIYFSVDSDCALCLNEISEFSKITDNNISDNITVSQLLFLFGQDFEKLKRVALSTDLNIPTTYDTTQNAYNYLSSFENDTFGRQLIFFDIQNKRILLRLKLRKGYITDSEYKKKILNIGLSKFYEINNK